MARIVLLHHIDDNFFHFNRRFGLRRKQSVFMMKSVLDDLARRGHRIRYESDPDRVSGGDLLILHVNLSRVPAAFLAAAARFPASINAAVTDISKRSYSQLLVVADSDWDGPVIVKSNLNYHGLPEVWHNERASARGLDAPYPDVRPVMDYDIYPRLSEVPEPCWTDPMRVVEKFIPEVVKDGFGVRAYIFCGAAERCTLHVAPTGIVKGEGIIRSEVVPVPPQLRQLRDRMGFDYGKFDFVMHNGAPVLLDANKTPSGVSARGTISHHIAQGNRTLADGLEGLLRAP